MKKVVVTTRTVRPLVRSSKRQPIKKQEFKLKKEKKKLILK